MWLARSTTLSTSERRCEEVPGSSGEGRQRTQGRDEPWETQSVDPWISASKAGGAAGGLN